MSEPPARDLQRAIDGSGPWGIVVGPSLDAVLASSTARELSTLETALAGRPGTVALPSGARGVATELALVADVIVCGSGTTIAGGGGAAPRLPGTARRLASRLGGGRALAFWLSRRGWSAARARRGGLVDVVARDPPERARRIVELWRGDESIALSLKLLVDRGAGLGWRGAHSLERALFALSFSGPSSGRGAREFLQGKRRRAAD